MPTNKNLKKFKMEERVQIVKGNDDLDKVILKHESGSILEVYLKGAHITSFKTSKNEELLFLSSKAVFKDKPIRGGIPLIFPQFGPGQLIQHGFARDVYWKVKNYKVENKKVILTLYLTENKETLELWKNQFVLHYTIIIDSENSFFTEFSVQNLNDKESFKFTCALHTYFLVKNIQETKIHGLKNLIYSDKLLKKDLKEENEFISFKSEMDTVYYKSPNQLKIECEKQVTGLEFEVFEDVVVWNPWNKSMFDMGEEDWKKMVCVEVAQIGNPIQLEPNQIWKANQRISKL